MRAWSVERTGPVAEVLTLGEQREPRPGPGEVVVAVEACGLNFSDLLLCQGRYQETPPLPFTPGTEVAGTVVATGAGCRLEVGDRIVGRVALPDGGLAEQARVPEATAFALGAQDDPVVAAAMHVTYQTAWFGLHRRARLQSGEVVLVHAGAGGTGSAAVQVAKAARARVITTAGGAAKVARCRDLGADLALDHRVDDVRAAVLEMTGGRGCDVVFDTVGGSSLETARRCIAFEGRIVLVGFASGDPIALPTSHVFVKNYSVLGLQWPLYERHHRPLVAEAHQALQHLLAEGRLRPLIGAMLPLADARDVLLELEAGSSSGKLVIDPRDHG